MSFQVLNLDTLQRVQSNPFSLATTRTASFILILPVLGCTNVSSASRVSAVDGTTYRRTSLGITSVRTARQCTPVWTRSSCMLSVSMAWAFPATFMVSFRSCCSRRRTKLRPLLIGFKFAMLRTHTYTTETVIWVTTI